MRNLNFMVDIETLSTAVNAVVLSIGAVKFDIDTGEIIDSFYHELRLSDQDKRHISHSTVAWWVKSVAEDTTRAKVFSSDGKTPVRNALILLKDFLGDEKKAVWACDPDFDCAILSNLYTEYGLPVPWRYYEPKSVRTIRELGDKLGLNTIILDKTHNALDDCVRQAKEVSHIVGAIYEAI